MREGEEENNTVENQELGVFRLTVDDKILDNIKDILLSNRSFIESQDETSKDNDKTEIKITLRDDHQKLTLDGFMSTLRYNLPFRQPLEIETLEFLSKYPLNQESLKSCIASAEEPDLLDSILDNLEEKADLSDIERLEVTDIKQTSSLKLLELRFNKATLLNIIFAAKNSSIDNQILNIKSLIEHNKFSWDKVTHTLEDSYLFGMQIELLQKLVEECDMPVGTALTLSQRCTINGNSINAPSSKDKYNEFLQSMDRFNIREDQESLVEISGDLTD